MTEPNLKCGLCLRLLNADEAHDYTDGANIEHKLCADCLPHMGADALRRRLAQPGWLATELPPNSDAFDDVMTDVERTERERDEE